jgi:hypothetical protein
MDPHVHSMVSPKLAVSTSNSWTQRLHDAFAPCETIKQSHNNYESYVLYVSRVFCVRSISFSPVVAHASPTLCRRQQIEPSPVPDYLELSQN